MKYLSNNLIFLILLASWFCFVLAADSNLDEKWLEFKKNFNKNYSDEYEEENRKNIFMKNLKLIEGHNKRFKEGKELNEMSINLFADMELKETIKKYTMKIGENPEFKNIKSKNVTLRGPLPKYVNWAERGFSLPVRTQGTCGSCYSFGAIAALEAAYFNKYKTLVKLSEQFGLDCSSTIGNRACSGGWAENVYKYAFYHGIGFDKDFPYMGAPNVCYKIPNRYYVKVGGYHTVPYGDEEELKKIVATVGPVTVIVNSGHADFLYYQGGTIYDSPLCSSHPSYGDHLLLLVGYGTTPEGKDYWILKNSWSENWGDGGYMKLARNHNNKCGIANHVVYPVDPYWVIN